MVPSALRVSPARPAIKSTFETGDLRCACSMRPAVVLSSKEGVQCRPLLPGQARQVQCVYSSWKCVGHAPFIYTAGTVVVAGGSR